MSSNVICNTCGQTFRTRPNFPQLNCKICRIKFCENCGVSHKRRGASCSSECYTLLRRKRSLEKYGVTSPAQLSSVREKTKKTCLEKYGTENPYASETIKEKIRKTCLEKYGTENPQQSQIVREKTEATCIEKYGTKTPWQSAECKEKAKLTCIEKYGVENPAQSSIIQEKRKRTCLDKYGVEHQFASAIIREKSRQTLLENFGVDSPMKSDVVKEKIKNNLIAKYGESVTNPSQIRGVQEKIIETSIKRYGVKHFTQAPGVKERLRNSMIEKYGVDNSFKLPHARVACHSVDAHKKRIETMRAAGANFQSSKVEDKLHLILLSKYEVVQRHVAVNGWDIDFYLEEIDTYVNMNGVYWHGRDMTNEQLKESPTKQSKTILGTKLRDELREKWFISNKKKLIIIWEDELESAIQKINS